MGALMVTFNSQRVTRRAVEHLARGFLVPEILVIVDNGSEDTMYLNEIERAFDFVKVLKLGENLGFCAGNNRGLGLIGDRHLLLLNPDSFVEPAFLRDAVGLLAVDRCVGAVGPRLLGADPDTGAPTGLLDSTGIAQTPWGRFYDRGMGDADVDQFTAGPEDAVALCAAAMLVRREAVRSVTVAVGVDLFDERFFMYKEDLDLSFRLQRARWRTVYDPTLRVRHCRGWKQNRGAMPAWARRRSLVNEWRLWYRGWTPGRSRWPALPYLMAKSVCVGLGR